MPGKRLLTRQRQWSPPFFREEPVAWHIHIRDFARAALPAYLPEANGVGWTQNFVHDAQNFSRSLCERHKEWRSVRNTRTNARSLEKNTKPCCSGWRISWNFDIAHSRISSYPYGHIKTAEERGECHVEKHLFAAGLQWPGSTGSRTEGVPSGRAGGAGEPGPDDRQPPGVPGGRPVGAVRGAGACGGLPCPVDGRYRPHPSEPGLPGAVQLRHRPLQGGPSIRR